jgi:hypothetical protein
MKYDRKSNLSYSGHFLKYATLASHLEPKLSDTEVIEAIRNHFPINVQRVMLGKQIQTIEDALDLLKRVELMKEHNPYFKQNYTGQQNQSNNNNRPGQSQQNRSRDHGRQVRRMQYFCPNNRNAGRQVRRNNHGHHKN